MEKKKEDWINKWCPNCLKRGTIVLMKQDKTETVYLCNHCRVEIHPIERA